MSAKFWNRLSHEKELWRQGISFVAGVDEAGCGPLAGPVVAAAVMFPCSWLEPGIPSKFRGLNDSKQLDRGQREKFFDIIATWPGILFSIVTVDVEMIDRINIRQAAWRGMHQALDRLAPKPQHVLVDGLRIKWLPYTHTALVDGDARSYTIAAASVLAKVTRDRLMEGYETQFPGYGFAEHKGYATPRHYEAIEKLGPSPIHRRSFAPFRPVEMELELFGNEGGPAPTAVSEP
jgi:ribonuclease HII